MENLNFIIFMAFLVILFITTIIIVNNWLKYLNQKNKLIEKQINNKVIFDYDEAKIIKHLDYIIDESIDNYVLFNITPLEIDYINSNMEKEMITKLQDEIPDKLSNNLLMELSYIYNENYLGSFLGTHIYLKITEYIVEYNMNSRS